jgi:hypothetical protein
MNKRERMYQRIERHGKQLLAIYPYALIGRPVMLCKRMRRLENKVRRACEGWCNGDIDEVACDKVINSVHREVKQLLGYGPDFFINRDARGYALKIDDNVMRELREQELTLPTDMGGYGILAPDLTED